MVSQDQDGLVMKMVTGLKEFDDIGIDGIGPESENYPGPDFGEGDGKPSQGWFVDANNNAKLDPEEVGSLQ
jgi:hypothetical protein